MFKLLLRRRLVCVAVDRSGCLRSQEGDQISMPASIMSELLRKQAEVPWQFELKLVRRRAPGKFEPIDVPAPPKEVSCCVSNHPLCTQCKITPGVGF